MGRLGPWGPPGVLGGEALQFSAATGGWSSPGTPGRWWSVLVAPTHIPPYPPIPPFSPYSAVGWARKGSLPSFSVADAGRFLRVVVQGVVAPDSQCCTGWPKVHHLAMAATERQSWSGIKEKGVEGAPWGTQGGPRGFPRGYFPIPYFPLGPGPWPRPLAQIHGPGPRPK